MTAGFACGSLAKVRGVSYPGRVKVLCASIFFVFACGETGSVEPLDPPMDCSPGRLNWVDTLVLPGSMDRHGGSGSLFLGTFSFTNPAEGQGKLESSGSGGERVTLGWNELLRSGGTVPAWGQVVLAEPGIDVGNCDTDFSSQVWADADGRGWTFLLRRVAARPYCGGVAVTGEFAACYREPDP